MDIDIDIDSDSDIDIDIDIDIDSDIDNFTLIYTEKKRKKVDGGVGKLAIQKVDRWKLDWRIP